MDIFAVFQTILYTISTALLMPVVALLILLCLWLFIYTGGFFGEWIKRRQKRSKRPLSAFLEEINRSGTLPEEVQSMLPGHITAYARDLENILKQPGILKAEKIEDLNQKKQHTLLKSVDKIRIVVRTGPSLGLMGTLIPMGTGLSGLTQGNMAQLSSSLILAFTTTVVGIALGISSYFFTVVKEQWMLEDMRRINLITEAMAKGLSKESAPTDTP
ncbi:MotA/TolQ/ExbB proton channel family protein [uncultured Desulfobacter sp.]|uniref:MotA/TolQ/ExbB proton channel family protein n=1 Tax=uncultured Desulfobacter sp. TaxID=240139 RepID=UPI002AAB430F|nr:MotA/TolQ/ExbB proton channel family protein [uncultured Desulfobacter sp.]